MRLIELFGGIGAMTSACKNIGVEVDLLDYVEKDKFAVASYNALNGVNFKTQDICDWDKDIEDVDLIMHGSPCQSFSVAGKQDGGDIGSNTKSSLMWETVRIVGKIKPKIVIWENVKNVLSKKHKHNFDGYLEKLEELGYKNYWEVLNAKNHRIPQNRERVFIVSIRKDILNSNGFDFPIGETDGDIITYTLQKQVRKRKNTCNIDNLKQLLKDKKIESGLTIKQISEIIREKKTLVEHWFRSDNCFSIPEEENWFKLKNLLNITTEEYDKFIIEFEILDGVYEKANRIYDVNGICPTLTTVGVPEICEFEFPEGEELQLRLKDILEDSVDEKYYLSQDKVDKLVLKTKGDKVKEVGFIPRTICEQRSDEGLRFFKNDVCGTIRTKDSGGDKRVLEPKINQIGMLDMKGNEQVRRVYGSDGISLTLNTMQGGNRQPKILAQRGRYNEDGKIEQQLEPRKDGNTNTITTVQKDNLLYSDYRIRKLTPKECWRLMGFSDKQFEKAAYYTVEDSKELLKGKKKYKTDKRTDGEYVEKMSSSQLYKQAGNSIVVNVLEDIIRKLIEYGYINV